MTCPSARTIAARCDDRVDIGDELTRPGRCSRRLGRRFRFRVLASIPVAERRALARDDNRASAGAGSAPTARLHGPKGSSAWPLSHGSRALPVPRAQRMRRQRAHAPPRASAAIPWHPDFARRLHAAATPRPAVSAAPSLSGEGGIRTRDEALKPSSRMRNRQVRSYLRPARRPRATVSREAPGPTHFRHTPDVQRRPRTGTAVLRRPAWVERKPSSQAKYRLSARHAPWRG
jgi:hypothetical protein